ncbi:MAG TPA: VPLPA-CTERM sorting domain-containing protein [Gammaproteobacteria bacterium]|nr:VPLPA-CTERM sorting domain-containing protein [Gammaproteobacteria bacterium]
MRSNKILGSILLCTIGLCATPQSALAVSLSGLITIAPGTIGPVEFTRPNGAIGIRNQYTGGSYFAMNANNPNANAAMLTPGTARGIELGTYQNYVLDPDVPHPQGWKGDINGDGVADGAAGTGYTNAPPIQQSTAFAPFSFFGVSTYIGLNPVGYQSGQAHAAPSVDLDMSSCVGNVCSLTADLSGWEVFWNGSSFEQGPRPVNTGPFGLATGVYDLVTRQYSLDWVSQINGGPFNGVSGFWHIEGSVVPVPAAVWLFASGLAGLAAAARRKPV